MSMWDEDDGEFRDIPDEAVNPKLAKKENLQNQLIPPPMYNHAPQPAPAPQNNQVRFNGATSRFEDPTGEVVQKVLEEFDAAQDEEEDYTDVLNDANLRIEQGRLYQMIMNHNIFEGMDADERAMANVQRQIRKFAREQMEIMLGMRQEQKEVAFSSPFNSLEVDILKKIASAATKGATERPEAEQIAEAVRETPKRHTLKPIGGSTGVKTNPKPAKAAPIQPKTPTVLPKTPQAPVKRTAKDDTVDQILAEEGLTREDVELNYTGIGKPLSQLTDQELAQRQKEAAERLKRHKTVKSPQALPMATPEQQELLAMSRAQQIGSAPGMSALLAKVQAMPVKNP